MTRRGLGAGLLEHQKEGADSLTREHAGTRARKPASKRAGRHATAGLPYKRVDGRTTRKLNANIASAVMSRLEKHLLLAKQRGWMRNEWIEAALDHAVRTDFMPELEQSSNDTETPP